MYMANDSIAVVRLSQEVDSYFRLWEELVPQVHGEVVRHAGENAKEVRFEITYGDYLFHFSPLRVT